MRALGAATCSICRPASIFSGLRKKGMTPPGTPPVGADGVCATNTLTHTHTHSHTPSRAPWHIQVHKDVGRDGELRKYAPATWVETDVRVGTFEKASIVGFKVGVWGGAGGEVCCAVACVGSRARWAIVGNERAQHSIGLSIGRLVNCFAVGSHVDVRPHYPSQQHSMAAALGTLACAPLSSFQQQQSPLHAHPPTRTHALAPCSRLLQRLFQYLLGYNELEEKIEMTTPVVTTVRLTEDDRVSSDFTVSFFLPLE